MDVAEDRFDHAYRPDQPALRPPHRLHDQDRNPAWGANGNVVATDSAVRVDPTTVHTGDVYLVLDVPQRGVELVSRLASSAREPLGQDDVVRLAQNVDSEGLALESLSVSCCGNVFKVSLPAGRYAFILRDATGGVGRPPESMAVLEVSP